MNARYGCQSAVRSRLAPVCEDMSPRTSPPGVEGAAGGRYPGGIRSAFFLFLLALFFSLALSMLIVYFMCPFLFSTNVATALRVRSFRSLSYFLWRFLVRIHSSLALEMARARMSSVCRDPLGDGFVRTCFFFFRRLFRRGP